ncbi:hypothetical protein N9355_06035 [Crocinitomicaceae bacterium]|nr:hypothetical protein [Crocinitomicaceae bacterium]
MKKFLFIFLLVFVALGCDKQKKHAKQMNGTWTIYSYTQITGVGFRTEFPAQGTITFEDLGNANLNYIEDFSYKDSANWIPVNRSGDLTIVGEKSKSFELTFTSPVNSETVSNTIHVVSKDDLKIQFQENGIGHLFVLTKN